MPYGMTESEWAWRYQNRPQNQVVQTTDCPRCHHVQGQICTTITGNQHLRDSLWAYPRLRMRQWTDAPHARRSTAIMEGI